MSVPAGLSGCSQITSSVLVIGPRHLDVVAWLHGGPCSSPDADIGSEPAVFLVPPVSLFNPTATSHQQQAAPAAAPLAGGTTLPNGDSSRHHHHHHQQERRCLDPSAASIVFAGDYNTFTAPTIESILHNTQYGYPCAAVVITVDVAHGENSNKATPGGSLETLVSKLKGVLEKLPTSGSGSSSGSATRDVLVLGMMHNVMEVEVPLFSITEVVAPLATCLGVNLEIQMVRY